MKITYMYTSVKYMIRYGKMISKNAFELQLRNDIRNVINIIMGNIKKQ